MKVKSIFLAPVIASLTLLTIAQPPSEIVGRWQGEKMGTPLVTLNVRRGQGGKLGGSAVFYTLSRVGFQGAPKVLGKTEAALVDPKMEGNIFSFKVQNQQKGVTLNPSSGESIEFKMTLHSDTEAVLKSESEGSSAVKMVKQK